jgi:hypothetical protein
MFPVMTEAELKAADEELLRQRVRDLSSAMRELSSTSAMLRQIRDLQHITNDCLLAILRLLEQQIEERRPKPQVKRRKPQVKRRKRKKS